MKRYVWKYARCLLAGLTAVLMLYTCYIPCTNVLAAAAPLDAVPPSIIDIMDISDDFKDTNFRQAVWEWLGKSGAPGRILEQDILDRLPEADYKLYVSECGIKDLSGLEYFRGLKELSCYSNQITDLPSLPDTLTILDCGSNRLDRLPPLPAGLEVLNCYGNKITLLPSLPGALKRINCGINELNSLQELPAGLVELSCEMNKLTVLPDLPAGLIVLTCQRNQLTGLPDLPDTLVRLLCEHNQLTVLPVLTDNIKMITCKYNQLTNLPLLPDTLRDLDCSTNKLTLLPPLPDSIANLNCDSNRLNRLPSLPEGLESLICSNNELTRLPSLPVGLDLLDCRSNRLIELKDVPARMDRLFCQYNYMDIFVLDSELEPGITSHYEIIPQLRLNYVGRDIELKTEETVKLENVLKIQACTINADGINWSNRENANISDLTFFSSDTGIASIDSEGNITGCGEGRCTIYADLYGLNTELTKTAVTVNVSEEEEETEGPEEERHSGGGTGGSYSGGRTGGSSSGEEAPESEIEIDYSSASEWAAEELRTAASYGLVTDKVRNLLKQDITREEFCSIAVKLYEALSGEKTAPVLYNPFSDTSDTDVLKAYEAGIVKGVSTDRFAPDNKITRQEICVMIYRAIRASKPDLNYDTTGVASFADEDQIADWAIQEVRFASKNNIMKGTGGNNISPLNNTSREQGIVLIKRTYEAFKNK